MMNRFFILASMLTGLMLFGEGSYITIKAAVAQSLIRSSWERSDQNMPPQVPWPWADTRVVAKMTFQSSAETQMVMRDASGESLAFGPGMVTPTRTGIGPVVIAGHRDTHFSHLRDIKVGQEIELELWQGRVQRFRISGSRVINSEKESLRVSADTTSLTLVTCWPFHAIVPGGPERLIVTAEPVT